eukprot:5760784-Amphidinium_carterae.2
MPPPPAPIAQRKMPKGPTKGSSNGSEATTSRIVPPWRRGARIPALGAQEPVVAKEPTGAIEPCCKDPGSTSSQDS